MDCIAIATFRLFHEQKNLEGNALMYTKSLPNLAVAPVHELKKNVPTTTPVVINTAHVCKQQARFTKISYRICARKPNRTSSLREEFKKFWMRNHQGRSQWGGWGTERPPPPPTRQFLGKFCSLVGIFVI